jgi:hypothetical protein
MKCSMVDLANLLKALEKSFPPPDGHHHSITPAREPICGGKDKLNLQIWITPNYARWFLLDDEDFGKPIDQLFDEIVAMEEKRVQLLEAT